LALRRDSHSCPQIFLDGSEDGLRIALDLALLDQVRRAATFPGISRANSLPEGDMASGQRDVPCGSKPEVAASIGYVRSTPKADFVVVMADVRSGPVSGSCTATKIADVRQQRTSRRLSVASLK